MRASLRASFCAKKYSKSTSTGRQHLMLMRMTWLLWAMNLWRGMRQMYLPVTEPIRGALMKHAKRATKRSVRLRIKASLVCEHFRELLRRAIPLGQISRSEVARRMQDRWPSDGRLGKVPSEKTLRNWIERGSPFPEHRVGKISLAKK